MLVRLPCLEPIMTTTTRPPRPPVPPSADPAVPLSLPDAEALGERIQAQAAVVAGATCQFLLLLADFDAPGGVGWFVGLKSTAHWLAWACSMSPGAAREHVRVARALPSMPLTVTEFQAGRLSYSKVREISRVIDRVDEQTLVEMARAMTASQLARTISSVRAVDGTRLGQDAVRQARWQHREDGMIEVRAVLPAEMGAEVVTALELALDRDGQAAAATHAAETDEPDALTEAADATTTATLEQRKADALVALRRRLEGAGHAVEPVVAVPVGILGQELLMLRLGRVVDAVAGLGERSQLRGDATATSCVERLLIAGHRLADDLALPGGGPVHGAAVLGAHVIALPHGGGGIVLLPELGQQSPQGGVPAGVDHAHRLGMAGAGGEDLFIGRVRGVAACVARRRRVHPGDLPGDPLDAPEAAAGQDDLLGPLRPRTRIDRGVGAEHVGAQHQVLALEGVGVALTRSEEHTSELQ